MRLSCGKHLVFWVSFLCDAEVCFFLSQCEALIYSISRSCHQHILYNVVLCDRRLFYHPYSTERYDRYLSISVYWVRVLGVCIYYFLFLPSLIDIDLVKGTVCIVGLSMVALNSINMAKCLIVILFCRLQCSTRLRL